LTDRRRYAAGVLFWLCWPRRPSLMLPGWPDARRRKKSSLGRGEITA